jgi:hypothetical protein
MAALRPAVLYRTKHNGWTGGGSLPRILELAHYQVPVIIRDAPDTGTVLPGIRPAGYRYPVNPKAGYPISGIT